MKVIPHPGRFLVFLFVNNLTYRLKINACTHEKKIQKSSSPGSKSRESRFWIPNMPVLPGLRLLGLPGLRLLIGTTKLSLYRPRNEARAICERLTRKLVPIVLLCQDTLISTTCSFVDPSATKQPQHQHSLEVSKHLFSR